MTDGSFLAFRKLQQNVPEFNKFLVDASNSLGTWSGQLGARLIGRWPSGEYDRLPCLLENAERDCPSVPTLTKPMILT